MAADSTARLYLCPICEKPFRNESDCRTHITSSKSGGHSGVNGHTMDRPLDIRVPQIEEYPVDEWGRDVVEMADEVADGDGIVPYQEVAEALDVPSAFVAAKLEQTNLYTPVNSNGSKATRPATEWKDLTDKQVNTLLTRAFFPDKTLRELSEMDFSGYGNASDISRTTNRYGWMLADPSIETPIEPSPESSREEGDVKTVGDTQEMVQNLSSGEEDESEDEEVYECEYCGEEFDAQAGVGAHIRWCYENPDSERYSDDSDGEAESDATADDSTAESTRVAEEDAAAGDVAELDGWRQDAIFAVLTQEPTFEVLAALIETERHETAQEVFRQATEHGGIDAEGLWGDE